MQQFLYNDFSTFLRRQFGCKVQKISIDAGFTCPNRDGTKGRGGCTYCNNQTFRPEYCKKEKTVREQLEEGRVFFSRKYPDMKYLAYFQSYTNTYDALPALMERYEQALSFKDVKGIVIATRPDCMPDALLDYLQELSQRTFLLVEYGIESTNDATLCRINRGHTYADTVDAVCRTAERGIMVGGHVILGLPGETRREIIGQAEELSRLPLSILKLHQLQLIRGTRMAKDFAENPDSFHLYDVDVYVDLVVDYVEHLRPDIVVERFASQSPKELLIAPDWGLKNYELVEKIKKRMKERGSFQGKAWH